MTSSDPLTRRTLLKVAGAGALGAVVPLGSSLVPVADAAESNFLTSGLTAFPGYSSELDDNLFGAGRFQRGFWYGSRTGGFAATSNQRGETAGGVKYPRWDEPSGYKVCRKPGSFPWVVAPHTPGGGRRQTATVKMLDPEAGGLLLENVTPGTIYARSYLVGPVSTFTSRTYQFTAILQSPAANPALDVGCYINLRFQPNNRGGDSPAVRTHIINSSTAKKRANKMKRIPAGTTSTMLFTQNFRVFGPERYPAKPIAGPTDGSAIPYSPSLECALFVRNYDRPMSLGIVQIALDGGPAFEPSAKRVT